MHLFGLPGYWTRHVGTVMRVIGGDPSRSKVAASTSLMAMDRAGVGQGRTTVEAGVSMYPFLQKLFADGGYQGPEFQKALAKILPHLETQIVKRSDHAKGFVVLPRRWVIERTIAWLNRCRRLAKDWENLNRKALAFLRLASIRLMLRKLWNPA
jgi:transposase